MKDGTKENPGLPVHSFPSCREKLTRTGCVYSSMDVVTRMESMGEIVESLETM